MSKLTFRISNMVIWLSSLFLGILTCLPKIAARPFSFPEIVVDACITILFTLFVWFFNIFFLPRFSKAEPVRHFSYTSLIVSLFTGIIIMCLLATGQQFLFPYLDFGSIIFMLQVKALLINLTLYMLLHLLHQAHQNQKVIWELERNKAISLAAKYELLRQKVNPSFLFSSLTKLKFMVERKDKHSVNFILELSDFYRSTLENQSPETIPLSGKIENPDAYPSFENKPNHQNPLQ